MQQLAAGLAQLSSNSAALNDGAKQVFETLLSTATSQLKPQLEQSGISIPDLTIENYSDVLTGVLATLDKAGTLAEETALQKVTAAVNAHKDEIQAGVTEKVKESVTQTATAAARQNVLTQVLAAQGISEDVYNSNAQVKAQVDAAVDQMMASEDVQTQIAAGVAVTMASDEVQAMITQTTQQQIELRIKQEMASEDVQKAILEATEKASAGAVQIRQLKQQLDQYEVFYLGVRDYTAGVDQAAAGAGQLQSNMPALISGVTQLRDGSMQLSDGLKQLNQEGIQKLTQALGDNVEGLVDRLTATVEVSRNYRSFSGISDGMDGEVRFVYRTDAVEAAE